MNNLATRKNQPREIKSRVLAKKSDQNSLARNVASENHKISLPNSLETFERDRIIRMLDSEFERWSHEITNLTFRNDLVIISVRITTNRGTREALVAEQFASPTDIRRAEYEALAKAAAMFSMDESRAAVSEAERFSFDSPLATSLCDMITGSQLSIIRKFERENGLATEKETQKLFGCEIGELSRNAAESLIDRLRETLDDESHQLRLIA